jgi:hypothetical protein
MSMPSDDHMSKAADASARRIEVFTGAGRRRAWTAAEKAAIVAESYAGAVSVCEVARRPTGLSLPSGLAQLVRMGSARRESIVSHT